MPSKRPPYRIERSEKIERALDFEQDLIVEGQFTGRLDSQGDLFVQQKGIFTGEAHIANAYIRGVFEGNLEASGQVFLSETAYFKGILDCPKANISLGARFYGEARIHNQNE